MDTDRVVVVGAGPAGFIAAVAAASSARTVLLDERTRPGGHLLAASSEDRFNLGPASSWPALLREHGVDYRPNTSAWALLPGPSIAAYDDNTAYELQSRGVIIATGTTPRQWPVPGWHLANVNLLSNLIGDPGSLRELQTKRVAIIATPSELDEAVRVVEQNGGTVVATTSNLASSRIHGTDGAEKVTFDGHNVDVDAVIMALGRYPDPTLVLQARAESQFNRDALIEMPLVGRHGETSLPGVFVAGEAAGVSLDQLAAQAEAVGKNVASGPRNAESAAQSLIAPRLSVDPLAVPRDPDTVICREQRVPLHQITEAIEGGAYDVNDVRKITRAGMGPGENRSTMAVLAAIMLATNPEAADASLIGRVRPPARPLPFRVALNTVAAD